jgi:nucleolar protein 14
MQRRNKVGGLVDRRFAENDPNISAEDKMMERFVTEKMRSHKKGAVFNLEDDGDDDDMEDGLTHMGKPLMFDDAVAQMRDDFNESDLSGDESDSQDERKMLKRLRLADTAEDDEPVEGEPERKKTKKEIYEEIIAKSKVSTGILQQ